jgi:hypothetical protein
MGRVGIKEMARVGIEGIKEGMNRRNGEGRYRWN